MKPASNLDKLLVVTSHEVTKNFDSGVNEWKQVVLEI